MKNQAYTFICGVLALLLPLILSGYINPSKYVLTDVASTITAIVTMNNASNVIYGNGANLTALNATQLTSGTVPDARFPATLPAASGANLTALNATNLASGTVPDARFPATLPAASGANLTALNAANVSGTFTSVKAGSAGTAYTEMRIHTQSLDPASVAAFTTAEQTFTLTGLDTSDFVQVAKQSLSAGFGIVNARCSANDTLAITFVNATAVAIDPGFQSYKVLIFRD